MKNHYLKNVNMFKFPALRNDLDIQESEEGYYVIRCLSDGNICRIKEIEYNVLKELDGNRTFFDIHQVMKTKYDCDIKKTSLSDFLEKAISLNLLINEQLNTDSYKNKHTSFLYTVFNYEICVFKLERLFDLLSKYSKYMFLFPFTLLHIIIMGIALVFTIANFSTTLNLNYATFHAITSIIIFMYISSFLHEIAHGLCCKHYNVRVDTLGIKLVFFIPVFFIRYQEAWLKPKKIRIYIRISGIYCELILYSILYLMNEFIFHSHFISLLLFILLLKIALNLLPFVPNDGHYILSEILNSPNLISQSNEYISSILRRNILCLNAGKK